MTPSELLARFGKDYPRINKQINEVLQRHMQGKLDPWPEWCFIPLKEFSEILMQERNLADDIMAFGTELHRLMAFGKWRFTQGIYRFSPEFFEEIKRTLDGWNRDCQCAQTGSSRGARRASSDYAPAYPAGGIGTDIGAALPTIRNFSIGGSCRC